MTFQRARSEEQREIRRRAILDTASAMLDEMPVAEVTLNELSRRVGLAKPNVLRYFESREAVLLELLDHFLQEWLAELAGELAAGIDEKRPDGRAGDSGGRDPQPLTRRAEWCCATSSARRAASWNTTSPSRSSARYKRASLDRLTTMTDLIQQHLPELGENATLFGLQTMVLAGALSAYSTPPPSLLAAYQAEPDLARFHWS